MTEERSSYHAGPTDGAEPPHATEDLVAQAHANRQGIPYDSGDRLLRTLPEMMRAPCDQILGGKMHAGDVAYAVAVLIDSLEHAPGDADRKLHRTDDRRSPADSRRSEPARPPRGGRPSAPADRAAPPNRLDAGPEPPTGFHELTHCDRQEEARPCPVSSSISPFRWRTTSVRTPRSSLPGFAISITKRRSPNCAPSSPA